MTAADEILLRVTLSLVRPLAARAAHVHGDDNPSIADVVVLLDTVTRETLPRVTAALRHATAGYAVPPWASESYRSLMSELAALDDFAQRMQDDEAPAQPLRSPASGGLETMTEA